MSADDPLALPSPATATWPALRIPCTLIAGLRVALEALGQPMGLHDDDTLVAEESNGYYRVALYVRPRGPEIWALSVVISPALPAVAVLNFENAIYRAPFDQTGIATVGTLPVELIVGLPPRTLSVTIEPLAA
jgi:hypothetical protein